jgi:hypothetical protein
VPLAVFTTEIDEMGLTPVSPLLRLLFIQSQLMFAQSQVFESSIRCPFHPEQYV